MLTDDLFPTFVLVEAQQHDWIATSSALLPPVIAIAAAIFAYASFKTAQNKLRLDLWEKRYAIFVAARDLMSYITVNGVAGDREIYAFTRSIMDARWMFDEHVYSYLFVEMRMQAYALKMRHDEMQGLPVGPARTACVDAQRRIKDWFADQYEVLPEKMYDDLRLSHRVAPKPVRYVRSIFRKRK